jgi:hypothetical protein
MNHFYTIAGGASGKETKNIYPQVLKPVAPKGTELYQKITKLRNKPNPEANDLVIELELDPKTNPTDFVSQSWIGATGLLLSQRAYDFLDGFSLEQEIETYKTVVHHKAKTHDYIWLNPVYNFDIEIDFSKTRFYLHDFLEDSREPVDIADVDALLDVRLKYNASHNIVVDEVYMKTNRLFNYDLFLMSIGSTSLRASERLKQALEKSKLTAFEFAPGIPFH